MSGFLYIGTNTTTVVKKGIGILKAIVVNDDVGNITVHDALTATTPTIGVIDCTKVLGTISFDIQFQVGLTVVTANGALVTVIYE